MTADFPAHLIKIQKINDERHVYNTVLVRRTAGVWFAPISSGLRSTIGDSSLRFHNHIVVV